MTSTEFAANVRYKTRTNSNTFPNADIVALMKIRQDEIALGILEVDEDILLIPQTADLVADQREYAFPSDILSRIKRVEAKLDGTNFIKLFEFDLANFDKALGAEANITNNFSNNEGYAFYDLMRKGITIYSGTITAVTGGIKVYCNTYPAAIAALDGTDDMSIDPSDTTHGIPRALHRLWAMGVAIDYKSSREKPIALSEDEKKYEESMEKAIAALKHGNLDREIVASVPEDDGSNY